MAASPDGGASRGGGGGADGRRFFKGRLEGIENDQNGGAVVMIASDDGRSHRVPIGVITRANLEVEF